MVKSVAVDYPLLVVENLKTSFFTPNGIVTAVDDLTFSIKSGQMLGIVGESGCGKSVTALSIMRIIPKSICKISAQNMIFSGKKLDLLSEKEMQKIRGNSISMIFQDPMTSLNPLFTIGEQIAETIQLHQNLNKKEALLKTVELLSQVNIPIPDKLIRAYPHQLSGGMKQRVLISMALSCEPMLLIADEPTTALDVTIQAQILDLMRELCSRYDTAIIFITHDLAVIAEMVEEVMVMYAGKCVEICDVKSIFEKALHPYTEGLIKSMPHNKKNKDRLYIIKGMVPSLFELPKGCNFHPRCSYVEEICLEQEPPLIEVVPKHMVSCWKYKN